MKFRTAAAITAAIATPIFAPAPAAGDDSQCRPACERDRHDGGHDIDRPRVQLGPRPYFLVEDMDESPLKRKLQSCTNRSPSATEFSIGHRGAPLQFPEHTVESYSAAARMGAGVLECDVSFTRDGELVCRHAQCDLHTTTNILSMPSLARHCSRGFAPAEFDAGGNLVRAASAKCCTSDLTVEQFLTLRGRMDASNPRATTVDEYLHGVPSWRTSLYASRGTLLTHRNSIELFRSLGTGYAPELKGVDAEEGFADSGLTQQSYARKLIDEYREAGIPPGVVRPQSFNLEDVLYWIRNAPRFGRRAVYLDGRYDDPGFDHRNPATWTPTMDALAARGVNVLAPPMWMLLEEHDGRLRPSVYAREATRAGLAILTWTLERSGPLTGGGGWYYRTSGDLVDNDGDMLTVLDVLAREVGVQGVFSDWPATTTFYANCMNIP